VFADRPTQSRATIIAILLMDCHLRASNKDMRFIFYDTETTGTNTAFDQILQFGAIHTDESLNELERFEVRCRLLPWVVPSPGALKVTGISPDLLEDPTLPSHYQMIRMIEQKLRSWSPATFIGYNSISFDENLLRQSLFQTLRPPYLTNTNGNCRGDVMRLAHACYAYTPNAIAVPLNEKNKPSFRLDRLAPANGFNHEKAHDAIADVEATIHLSKLIRDRARPVWDRVHEMAHKPHAQATLDRELILCQTEFYASREHSWLVTKCGRNPGNSAEVGTFDLSIDPTPYFAMDEGELVGVLTKSPKAIRTVRTNAQPILMHRRDATLNTNGIELSDDKLMDRARAVQSDHAFQARVGLAMAKRYEDREPSPYPELQIYDRFPDRSDDASMIAFHNAENWQERADIAGQFDDRRLKHFAFRTVYAEAPDVLKPDHRAKIEDWIRDRVQGTSGGEPWTTLPAAIDEVAEIQKLVTGDHAEQMVYVTTYLHRLQSRWS
jgi:exodeoxyribonuclease I